MGGYIWGYHGGYPGSVGYIGFSDIPKKACIKIANMDLGNSEIFFTINKEFRFTKYYSGSPFFFNRLSVEQAQEECSEELNEIIYVVQ